MTSSFFSPSSRAALPTKSVTPPPVNSPTLSAPPVEAPHPPVKIAPRFTIAIPSTTRVPGVDQHISYTIVTRFHGPGGSRGDRECVVSRRYRDFVWLWGVLQAKNPGVIVPPLPEKQALGRFQEEFVESRRSALERCVRKMGAHPRLADDPDLRSFLESDSFSPDPSAVTKAKQGPSTSSSGAADWFGSLSERMVGALPKAPEGDEWFENKKYQLELLGTQLRALYKAVEGVIKQRKELGAANFEFGESLISLSAVEVDRPLVHHLSVLGEICKKMRDMQMRQARIDMTSLANTVDEYVRFLTSIEAAFASRLKVFHDWKAAESAAVTKKIALEKAKAGGRSKAEKLPFLQQEAEEAESLNQQSRKEFEDVTERLRTELIRFDREKVEDFTTSLQQFLEGILQTQKEVDFFVFTLSILMIHHPPTQGCGVVGVVFFPYESP
ncbi:Vps5-domain-containing protein [Gonapodya prolifera JEL478]|uniref:Vps5-domain-containing protein n=1 Tax=Gonapodya prolifera (strain JEL478) TaxID=1344416 RepID=A0A139ASN4_GONPJ|nr:Vps5-domain-containing protein [Gonapodya prolifera JEL478]|eukprot:KXS19751.1 Vps5-domain-containing protein [Gonapodya prolifera JEL478]